MPLPFRRSLPITGAAVVTSAVLSVAQTHATPAPRVRPETAQTTALLNELLERSHTARELVETLSGTDLVAYVRHRTFTTATLNGRTGLVRSEAPTRTLIVEIAGQRSWLDQMVTLGHELQHVVEIAAEPAVVDPPSMVRYFSRIGIRTPGIEAASFETERAVTTAKRIRQELYGNSDHTRIMSHERH